MQDIALIETNNQIRLDAIVSYLNIGKKWQEHKSERAVIDACLEKVDHLIDESHPYGEHFSHKVATDLQIKFEEVHDENDIVTLETEYLHGKNELGFALLREEIQCPEVDALLFQRQHAAPLDPDKWVGILNMTYTKDRAYWNRFHEIAHRLSEPPQGLLPFHRQLHTSTDPVEKLMDQIASNLAFHPRIFNNHIYTHQDHPLTFSAIDQIRSSYARSASLLSITNAAVKAWNRPTLSFIALEQSKKNGSGKSLRITYQCWNKLAKDMKLFLFPNMRVPKESSAYNTFTTGLPSDNVESTKIWTTSDGSGLPDYKIHLSCINLGERIYGTMTVL